MQPETQITYQTPTDHAAVDAAVTATATATAKLYPLDQMQVIVAVKKGIVAGEPLFATLTLRKPLEKELIEKEKTISAGVAQISKNESEIETGDETSDLQLVSQLITAIANYNLKDNLPVEAERPVNAQNVKQIPATMRLAALRALYASTCKVYTLDLENGVAIIKQELGTRKEPDYVILHTLDISDEKLRTQYKAKTQKVMLNSRDPRVQRQSVRMNLAKIVEFYNTYFLDIEGVSIGDQSYTDSQRMQALTLLDAYWKRQVMTTLMAALEDGLQD